MAHTSRSLFLLTGLVLLLVSVPRGVAQGQQPFVPRVDAFGDPLPHGAIARLGTVRLRHSDNVFFVAFAEQGKLLISAGIDGLVKVWEASTGKELRHFRPPVGGRLALPGFSEDPSFGLAVSGDGKVLAVKTDEGICVSDVTTGKELSKLAGDGEPGKRGSFSRGPYCVLSHDGALLANWQFYTGPVMLWDTRVGMQRTTLILPEVGFIRHVAFTPDGRAVATFEQRQEDLIVRFWDPATGKTLRSFAVAEDTINSFHFLPGGKALVTLDTKGTIRVLDATTGKQIRQFGNIDVGATGKPPSLTLSTDGTTVAVTDRGQVRLWEVASGKELSTISVSTPVGQFSQQQIAISPDGKALAASALNVIQLWDVAGGKQLLPVQAHEGAINSVSFARTDKLVATSGADSTVRLWDAGTGQSILPPLTMSEPMDGADFHDVPGFGTRCAFSPDGKVLAGTSPGGKIHLWDAVTGKPLRTLGDTEGQRALTFSPAGRLLASLGMDGVVRVWDVASSHEVRRFTWYKPSDPQFGIMPASVAFSPDGRTLAASGVYYTFGGIQHLIRLWEVDSRRGFHKFIGLT